MGFLSSAGAFLANPSAAISAVTTLGDTALNNYYDKKAAKQAYERDIAFWNMQNEYNTPANQMARLKEAGLNPNLIYGNITPGNSSSSVHATPAQRSSNFAGIIDNLLRWKKENEENKLLEEQNVQADALTNKVTAEAAAAKHNEKLAEATLARYLSDNKILGIGGKGFVYPSTMLNNPKFLSIASFGQDPSPDGGGKGDEIDMSDWNWFDKLNYRFDPTWRKGDGYIIRKKRR